MRPSSFAVLTASILLFSACGTGIGNENRNPLTASRYGDELADRLADLIIQNDPVTQQPGMQDYIKGQISNAKNLAADARSTQARGMMGGLIPAKQNVTGYGLYVDDVLYLSSDFDSDPGPDLHVYLTTVVDPRDVQFPDKTALDLGTVQSPYGALSYDVPHQDKPELLRTIVFYDRKLQRLYSFAQLSSHRQR